MTAIPTTPAEKGLPDIKINVRQVFGIDSDIEVPGFSEATDHVPEMDNSYIFDHDTTLAGVLPITGG